MEISVDRPDFLTLALSVTAGRGEFERIYDALLLQQLVPVQAETASPTGEPLCLARSQPFKLVETMQHRKGDPPYMRAFEQAWQRGWLASLLSQLLAAEAIDTSRPTSPINTELQKVLRPDLGFLDPLVVSTGTAKAIRRVCLIRVIRDGKPPVFGSGFLVGPQAVLTSWHVVMDFVDMERSQGDPAGARSITVSFDYNGVGSHVQLGLAPDWLIGFSPAHGSELDGQDIMLPIADGDCSYNEHLDCAILRLAFPFGRERGFYPLLPALSLPELNRTITVVQHPGGDRILAATGAFCGLWPNEKGARMRHDANTAQGSSGGAVFDADYRLLALHQATVQDEHGKLLNSAIPAANIAKLGLDCHSVIGVDPYWRLPDGTHVFGRVRFQEFVADALDRSTRAIVVTGEGHVGKSFSVTLLKGMLGSTEHRVLEVQAAGLPVEASELARFLATECGAAQHLLDGLPERAETTTSEDAWLRSVLLPYLLRIFYECARGGKLWLVFDDLDRYPLPQCSGLTLLSMLAQQLGQQTPIRLLLLGALSFAASAAPLVVATDRLSQVTEQDIAQTWVREMTELGRDDDAAAAPFVARAVIESGMQQGRVPLRFEQAYRNMLTVVRGSK